MHLGKRGRWGSSLAWMIAAAPLAFGSLSAIAQPVVSTDLSDYAPGDTAIITGSGFDANADITLQVIHLSGGIEDGEGHNPWVVVSDENGGFTSSWYLRADDSGGSTLLLTAESVGGQHAETVFTDTVPGHGVVTAVAPDNGGCVAASATTASTTWDVQPGLTYLVTISGADDAANGGTDATTPFFLLNATTGNLCLTANQVAPGVYTAAVTLPVYACETYTINYGSCDTVTARRARGDAADADPSTSTNGVHLRANAACSASSVVSCSTIEACCIENECSMRTIANCLNATVGHPVGTPQGYGETCDTSTCKPPSCDVECPVDITVDCNGSTDPADTGIAGCSEACDPDYVDDVQGGACPQEARIARTWTCTNPSGATASCTQIITVLDTTPPVVTCPADCEIECGQTTCTAPLCDDDGCQCGGEASCLDDCGDCSVTSSCEFVEDQCPTQTAGVTPPPKVGTIERTFTSTDGASTVATGSCPNTATCTQKIKIVDTIPPDITCSVNKTVRHDPGQCCATVEYTTNAADSCDDHLTVDCTQASGTCFPVGTTNVNCIATDDCSNEDGCTFSVTVKTSICGRKTYDKNVDGDSTGDPGIRYWKVVLSGSANKTAYTDANGNYCFNDLLPGNYTVREIMPCAIWVNTTPTSCTFTDMTCPKTCEFSNVCLGNGGGHTIGYWSNKNGCSAIGDNGSSAPELAMLSALNLRTSSGGNFNPSTISSLQSWFLGANSTNMAYMLSAQLAAMELGVEKGNVDGTALIHAPGCGGFITVNALMTAANTALGADGYTPSGDPNRTLQTCLKDALDRGNNDRNFVQDEACPISHY